MCAPAPAQPEASVGTGHAGRQSRAKLCVRSYRQAPLLACAAVHAIQLHGCSHVRLQAVEQFGLSVRLRNVAVG